jgi:hypothetical protein
MAKNWIRSKRVPSPLQQKHEISNQSRKKPGKELLELREGKPLASRPSHPPACERLNLLELKYIKKLNQMPTTHNSERIFWKRKKYFLF